MSYDESNNELIIDDLSDSDVQPGFYNLVVTLDDGEPENLVTESVMLTILDAIPIPEEEPEPEPEE